VRAECCDTGYSVPTQLFTKTVRTEPSPLTAKVPLSSVANQHGLKRLTKSEAKTPEGVMRLAHKIIQEDLPETAKLKTSKTEGPSYAEQRCRSIDPNTYRTRTPFHRVESPHGGYKRRPAGWTDCRLILPAATLEGLRALTIELAHEQQNSDWPQERGRYPRTKNYYVVWALNELFKKLGFSGFCVEEQRPIERRHVRRFVAPTS
jgi:hypothetical protein